MPTEVNGILRYDINDPSDLADLIRSGLIWRGGPAARNAAYEYLRAHPEAVNDTVPADVRALLQPAAPAAVEPETPSEDATEPGEETTGAA